MSRYIVLTNGGYTYVDDEDYEYLSQWNWQANRNDAVNRCDKYGNAIYMHRVIAERMGLEINNLLIDHKDQNPFNNRRNNLRIATKSQNQVNGRKHKDNASGYKGVSLGKRTGKWHAATMKDGIKYYLGSFYLKENAARAYDKKAIELFGEFACLNFPEEHVTEIFIDNSDVDAYRPDLLEIEARQKRLVGDKWVLI